MLRIKRTSLALVFLLVSTAGDSRAQPPSEDMFALEGERTLIATSEVLEEFSLRRRYADAKGEIERLQKRIANLEAKEELTEEQYLILFSLYSREQLERENFQKAYRNATAERSENMHTLFQEEIIPNARREIANKLDAYREQLEVVLRLQTQLEQQAKQLAPGQKLSLSLPSGLSAETRAEFAQLLQLADLLDGPTAATVISTSLDQLRGTLRARLNRFEESARKAGLKLTSHEERGIALVRLLAKAETDLMRNAALQEETIDRYLLTRQDFEVAKYFFHD